MKLRDRISDARIQVDDAKGAIDMRRSSMARPCWPRRR
jgi:hypothetical protein